MSTPDYLLDIVTWQETKRDIRLLRNTVFIEELGIPAELEWDGTDSDYSYLLARNSVGHPIGTGRISNDDHNWSVGRFGIMATKGGRNGNIKRANRYCTITTSESCLA